MKVTTINNRLVLSCIVATSSVAVAGAFLYRYAFRSETRKRNDSKIDEEGDNSVDYPSEIKEELLSRVS